MSSSNNLNMNTDRSVTLSAVINVCVYDGIQTHPDVNDVLDALLLLQWVKTVGAHEVRLQHVTHTAIQTEESAVQLGVFIL